MHEGRIVSEGYHQRYGEAHAEVHCLQGVTDESILHHSTLYVSLEPCHHHGKTPPCTDLILSKGIPKVVVGTEDFNPRVRGQGIRTLQNAGVEVVNHHLEGIQRTLNVPYYIRHQFRRPFVRAKFAMSQDGFIGREGESIKITSREMDFWSHQLRAQSDAILVGKNTWNQDRPQLDTRLYHGQNPKILILSNDTAVHTVEDDQRELYILNPIQSSESKNIHWIKYNTDSVSSVLEHLYTRGIGTILVEGGASVLDSFLRADLVDELIIIQNHTRYLGTGIAAPEIDYTNFELQDILSISNETRKRYGRC